MVVAIGSRAEHGSSINITSGLTARQRAIDNRWSCPPESETAGASRRSFTSSHKAARARLVATLKIEELIEELKKSYTIVIVTHNMQQAARVADKTAFMLSGELVEYDETEKIFTNPGDTRTEQYVTGKFG